MFGLLKLYCNNILLKILIFVTFFILSCNKFDEGVNISLRSEENRLSNIWEYVSVKDMATGKIKTSGFEGWTETLNKDGTYEKKIIYFGDESLYTGRWEYNGETTLKLSYTVHQNEINETFEIRRLSNRELIMRNEEKEIHLQKK